MKRPRMCTECRVRKHRARGLCDRCYKVARMAALREGRWQPKRPTLVDGAAAAEHLERLAAAGLSRWQVVYLTGLHHVTVYGIQAGRNVVEETSNTILAVPLPRTAHTVAADKAFVPACGTTRRLQALCALGWPIATLAERLGGRERGHLAEVCRGDRATVMAHTARAVEQLYEQLSGTPGPSRRVMLVARSRKYAPPLAWECICVDHCECSRIDDPGALPEGLPTGDSRERPFSDRYQDVVTTLGLKSEADIAHALGITEKSLARQLAPSRHGRTA